jgi:hypothetical protein
VNARTSLVSAAGSPELSFVLGLAAVQLGGGLIGMCFAYFFARFFRVHATLWVAAPVVALLAWSLIGAVLAREVPEAGLTTAGRAASGDDRLRGHARRAGARPRRGHALSGPRIGATANPKSR